MTQEILDILMNFLKKATGDNATPEEIDYSESFHRMIGHHFRK